MPVRLKDIAAEVGLSVQVTSKVLNGGSSTIGASPATRRRVLEAARRMGYRRHAAGSALRRQSFRSIGLLMGGAEDAFLPQRLIGGIAGTLSACDYTCCLVAAGSLDDADQIDRQPLLAERMVDALIIGYSQDPPPALQEAVARLSLPVVWLYRHTPHNAVTHDEGRAAELLVEHLAGLGHAAITYLDYNGRRDQSAAARDRLAGFFAACQRRRVEPVLMNDRHVPRPERAAASRAWLQRPSRTAAVIVDSCTAAQVVLDVAHQSGTAVPHDLAIASFDSGSNATANDPAITVALLSEEKIGTAAAELSLELIRSGGTCVDSRLVQPSLLVGGTTVETATPSSPTTSATRPIPSRGD